MGIHVFLRGRSRRAHYVAAGTLPAGHDRIGVARDALMLPVDYHLQRAKSLPVSSRPGHQVLSYLLYIWYIFSTSRPPLSPFPAVSLYSNKFGSSRSARDCTSWSFPGRTNSISGGRDGWVFGKRPYLRGDTYVRGLLGLRRRLARSRTSSGVLVGGQIRDSRGAVVPFMRYVVLVLAEDDVAFLTFGEALLHQHLRDGGVGEVPSAEQSGHAQIRVEKSCSIIDKTAATASSSRSGTSCRPVDHPAKRSAGP
ncbi:UNVERIFIED_CONTAM: hypothetical protein PYX00_006784 [Menopon gallinae]|uniref:Uncharacterized protein n=1 Tax=Menopon gallinae TaxID=328185 RepID=A0AAW2HX03_9NEOP